MSVLDLGTHPAVATERRVDRAALGRRAALDERDVLAGDVAPAQRFLQGEHRLLVAGEQEQARGVAVQSVHDAGPVRVVPARDAARQGLHERPVAVAHARVDDDAGGLVDHDQAVVLVGDLELRRRDRFALGLRQGGELDRLAAQERVALLPGLPSTCTRPASISFTAFEREPGASARKTSSRSPAASAGTSMITWRISPGRRSGSARRT